MLRRVMALAAALLLSLAALAEAPCCVVEGGVAALVDAKGDDIIPTGVYVDIFPVVPGSLYAAGEPGAYALVNAEGEVVAEGPLGMIDDDGAALLFRRDWRYGAMDRNGSVLVDPVWTQLVCDGRGGFLAVAGNAIDERADTLFHIDENGSAVDTGVLTLGLMRRVFEDRMAVCGADGLWGYVDGGGSWAIPATWRAAGDFEDGRAIVAGEAGCGVIGPDGEVLVAPEYACVIRCGVRYAALQTSGQLDIYDVDSCRCVARLDGVVKNLIPLGDAAAIVDEEGAALLDERGREVCRLSEEGSFEAGDIGQYIATEGPWGEADSWIVNADGTAASGRYQLLRPLCEGRYAFARMNGVEYYSEALGDTQKSWDYDSLRYGMLDGEGQELLPAEYLLVRALDDDHLVLLTEEAVVLADRDGNALRTWPRSGEASGGTGE